MPLAEDQRAMLQLLLEGGQSYADIGSLLGVDAAEVRTKARSALTEMGGADPDAQVGLTDYLLGQADPIGRADAAHHLQNDPAAASLAARLAAQLRLLAPSARLPDLPAASAAAPVTPPPATPATPATPSTPAASPAGAPPAGTPGGPSAPGGVSTPGAGARAADGARSIAGSVGSAFSGLAAKERRLPVALGAGAILILVIVLIATGVLGGGDDKSSSDTSTTASGSAGDVTAVDLKPTGDQPDAGGQATFARAQDQPILQLNLFGLEPTKEGEVYILWLQGLPDQVAQQLGIKGDASTTAFPLAQQTVDSSGNLTGAAPIPSNLISLLPYFQQIDVSLASTTETAAALKQAAKDKQLPQHSGNTVLTGDIPRDPTASVGGAAGTSTGATGTTPAPTTTSP